MARLVLLLSVALVALTFAGLLVVACARQDPPPGTPADPGKCPDDAGSETLPRELACCLLLARTSEDAKICLAKADGGP